MRILQILPKLGQGGVEEGTLQVSKNLVLQGHSSFVASFGGEKVARLEKEGGCHIALPLHSKNPIILYKNKKKIENLIVRYKIDVVHARSRAPAWSAFFASKSLGVPFVTTFHGVYNFTNRFKRFYNSVMVRGDRVIAISDFIKDHLLMNYREWVSPERVRRIYRGIDLDYFSEDISEKRIEKAHRFIGIKKETPFLLMPGRLTRWKGQLWALRAFQGTSKGHLFFVGDPQGREAYLQELKEETHLLGLSERVSFFRNYEDLPALYKASCGIIHASTDPEAFGRTIAEAQAMGVPVIASSLGAPQEIVRDGETGWIVDPLDRENFSKKMQDLLDLKPEKRDVMGKAARQRVERFFSQQEMVDQTLSLYEDVIERNRIDA